MGERRAEPARRRAPRSAYRLDKNALSLLFLFPLIDGLITEYENGGHNEDGINEIGIQYSRIRVCIADCRKER